VAVARFATLLGGGAPIGSFYTGRLRNPGDAMAIVWDVEQLIALEKFDKWRRDPPRQGFLINGYAGTGKTTLAQELKRIFPGVLYAAYTNKAVFVLRSKGCNPAATLHSIVYVPDTDRELGQGALEEWEVVKQFDLFLQKSSSPRPPGWEPRDLLILDPNAIPVIDEVSMIGRKLGRDILGMPHLICMLGDNFQLPPIGEANSYFFRRGRKPDVVLTQIHRTSNPGTLLIADYARNSHYPPAGEYHGSAVIKSFGLSENRRRDIFDPLLMEADQVVCGFNRSRVAINCRARELNGLAAHDPQGMPVPGDKLVCYRHSIVPRANDPDEKTTVINGSLWQVTNSLKCETLETRRSFMAMTLTSLDDPKQHPVLVRVPSTYFNPKSVCCVLPHTVAHADIGWDVFTYGYAITCHKAQGSEWKHVAVVDQSWGEYFRPYRWRWLYTAVTRASEHTTLIRGPWR